MANTGLIINASANLFAGLPGAKGDKGDKGDTGDQGPQGEQGLPGQDAVWGLISGTLSAQTDLQNAFDAKQATLTEVDDVPGLTTALANKAALSHSHIIAEITGLQAALDGKQAVLTGTSDVPGLDSVLATKANAASLGAHTGDNDNPHNVTASQVGAYTTGEVDTALSNKQNNLPSGLPLQTLRVNAAGDGLEFTDPSGGVQYAAGGGTQDRIHVPDANGDLALSGWRFISGKLHHDSTTSTIGNNSGTHLKLSPSLETRVLGLLAVGFDGLPARTLEARNGTGVPQERLGYDATRFAERRVDANGYVYHTTTGNRWYWDDGAGNTIRIIPGPSFSATIISSGSNLTLGSANAARMYIGSVIQCLYRLEAQNGFRINSSSPPSSATDTGLTGEIRWDANYLYICIATNTWKRSALATW